MLLAWSRFVIEEDSIPQHLAYKLLIFIRLMRNADFDISYQELDAYMRELLDDPQLALPEHMSMRDLICRHVLPVVVLGTPLLFLTGYPMESQIGYIQI